MPLEAPTPPSHDFARVRPRLEQLLEEVDFTLSRAMDNAEIKTHSITGRVKTVAAFNEKVRRKGYAEPLSQMTDQAGARVVCLTLSDLGRVKDVVRSLFDIREETDTVEGGDPSTFGYMSAHFVCELGSDFNGPRYDDLKGFQFEVQCRTIVMDAWASLSHHLAYKGDASLPDDLRRNFHALSGLFYVADQQFEHFMDQSQRSVREATAELDTADQAPPPGDVLLNRDTLYAYLVSRYPDRNQDSLETVSELLEELVASGVTTMQDLHYSLEQAERAAAASEKAQPPTDDDENPVQFSAVGFVRTAMSILSEEFRLRRDPRSGFRDHSPLRFQALIDNLE